MPDEKQERVAPDVREAQCEIREYTKQPVTIKAFRWNGRDDETGMGTLFRLLGDAKLPHAPDDPHIHAGFGYTPFDGTVTIPTLEGTMTARPGDWIIRGVKGELYPCKADIFASTYAPAVAEAPAGAQRWNGTVQPNGTVYDDETLITLMRGELAQKAAQIEILSKRLYDAGLSNSYSQEELQHWTEIKMGAYPVYLREVAEAPAGEDAKELSDLLCPPHASLDNNGHLEPFDNCIACIRVQRDELIELLKRISTDIGQTIIEDPIRAADGWAMLSTPVIKDIQAAIEPYTDASAKHAPSAPQPSEERK